MKTERTFDKSQETQIIKITPDIAVGFSVKQDNCMKIFEVILDCPRPNIYINNFRTFSNAIIQ